MTSFESAAQTPIDSELMRLIAERQEEGLSALYDRHSGLVFSLCLRILADRDEAEEVMLDVFQEIWEKPERFNPERGAPRTYLLTLTRSRAIDRLRRLGRRPESKTPPAAAEVSEMSAPLAQFGRPDEALRLQENRDLVRGALAKLSEEQRDAIELAYYEGLSHREIAEHFQAPLGTVKTRIRQGMLHLRDLLRLHYSESDFS